MKALLGKQKQVMTRDLYLCEMNVIHTIVPFIFIQFIMVGRVSGGELLRVFHPQSCTTICGPWAHASIVHLPMQRRLNDMLHVGSSHGDTRSVPPDDVMQRLIIQYTYFVDACIYRHTNPYILVCTCTYLYQTLYDYIYNNQYLYMVIIHYGTL